MSEMLRIKQKKEKERLCQVIKDNPILSSAELEKMGFSNTILASYYIMAKRKLKIKSNKQSRNKLRF